MFICVSGADAAHAPLHWGTVGVFSRFVGSHVNGGITRFPLCPHSDRPTKDVNFATDIQHT